MENRWSTRKPFTGSVIVESARLGRICGTLRDISLGGVLVDIANATLPLNAPVSVALNLCTGDHRGDYRLRATVVRRSPTAAGLLFHPLDTETVRSLRATIYGQGGPLPSPSGAWKSRAA